MKIPKTLDEYFAWAVDNIASDFTDATSQSLYETNLANYFNSISAQPFTQGFTRELERFEVEYRQEKNSELLMEKPILNLLQKPYESAVDKSFRHNILRNENFPNPPKNGWITTDNMHYCLNDAIRSSIVCKFIDGPSYVTDRLMAYAKSLGLERRRYSQEREDGYYAYHYYVKFPVKSLDKSWQISDTYIEVEIQVTTQLQDVLRNLTHVFYREIRLSPGDDKSKWKWDFGSNRFRVSYLSHALHLLESIILESRDGFLSNDKKA